MSYIGNSGFGGVQQIDAPTFDGVTTSFPITVAGRVVTVPRPEALIVSMDGAIQQPNSAYQISGANLVFTTAPAATESFFGILLGEMVSLNGTLTSAGGDLAGTLNWAGAQTIASAATTDIGSATSNVVTVSGTTTITSFGGLGKTGAWRLVAFTGALTITNNASIILPNGNITTSPGMILGFLNTASGVWTLTSINNKNIDLASSVVTGTTTQFNTALSDGDFVIDNGTQTISTATTAVAGKSYIFTASCELTLPAAPTMGQMVQFANWSAVTTCTVNPNGLKIMGVAETLTVEVLQVAFTLKYIDSTRGWIFV